MLRSQAFDQGADHVLQRPGRLEYPEQSAANQHQDDDARRLNRTLKILLAHLTSDTLRITLAMSFNNKEARQCDD